MLQVAIKQSPDVLISVYDFLQNLRENNEDLQELLKDSPYGEIAFELILAFAQKLDKVSYKLEDFEHDMATRILWLIFKTRYPNKENFWDPMFKKVACTEKSSSDDEVWDKIREATAPIKRLINNQLPSHAGKFPYRIPKILIEVEY